MTEGENGATGNTVKASKEIKTPILAGQLFGPFSDALQWLAVKSKTYNSNEVTSASHELFNRIDIARFAEEQNFEIVAKNGQFYFRALKDIADEKEDCENKQIYKFLAWFSEELAAKLPVPASSTLNGGKRFYCTFCNEIFVHPNPAIIHLLFDCLKNTVRENVSLKHTVSQKDTSNSVKSAPGRKRGFDIASLVNEESNESPSVKKSRNSHEQLDNDKNVVSASPDNYACGTSAFHRPKSPQALRPSLAASSISSLSSVANAQLPQLSAFKKVDQKNNSLSNPYDISQFYQRAAATSLFSQTSSALIQSLQPSTTMPSSLSTTVPKSTVSNTLLPFLPPSLAALTFPTSNWCAKCNATFRMTSDLVYHMRSHHKNVSTVDPLKKKREEKLRCNICQETFREKHHLTRHMTSHQ